MDTQPSFAECIFFEVSFGPRQSFPAAISEGVIRKHPNILGGELVFRGTRVPFKVLTDYLEGGDTLDQFLEEYPSVSRELAVAAIEEARLSLIAQLK
jgi:uncharacterized protein (DUF433 family)